MSQKYGKQLKINLEDFTKKYLSGVKYKDLCEEFKCSTSSICRILKKIKIKRKKISSKRKYKYNIDHNYFNTIDTEDKAYFLGLLYADGSVSKKNNYIILTLKESDKEILNKFNFFLKNEKPLKFHEKRKEKHSNIYSLVIYSKQIKDQLILKGCHPNKTFSLRWPKNIIISNNLISHFVRGYFDGDGCFTYRLYKGKYLKPAMNFVSTLDFCKEMANLFLINLNCNCHITKRYKTRDTNTRQLEISGSKQILKILEWMYKDSTIYISRKFDKYQSFLKDYNFFIKKNPNYYNKKKLSSDEEYIIKNSNKKAKELALEFKVSISKIYKIKYS